MPKRKHQCRLYGNVEYGVFYAETNCSYLLDNHEIYGLSSSYDGTAAVNRLRMRRTIQNCVLLNQSWSRNSVRLDNGRKLYIFSSSITKFKENVEEDVTLTCNLCK